MLELAIWGKPEFAAKKRQVEIPKPGPKEVLVKVVATGLNPKDWKWVRGRDETGALNAGDDIAGIVEAVGSDVFEYKAGDRVAAFHRMGEERGGYAEYSVVPASTTFPLPPNISFDAGATLPLAFMTASLGLYQNLQLPLPTIPGKKDIPIVIYGGATAVGAYALQLAKLSKFSPIITVAGSGIDFVKSLDSATHIIDYRKGNVEADILAALGGKKLAYAFDTVGGDVWETLANVMVATNGGGHIDFLDPPQGITEKLPAGVRMTRTFVASAYGAKHQYISEEQAALDGEFAYIFYRYLSHLLAEGKFRPHPVEVLPGGLDGVLDGVKALYNNKVSAKKLVARIAETPGL
ncbi:GroES-like protein [Thozetella sp. PMI_491]|nr:GroES-like protein [Thozetella sp. PMI_491]